MRTVPLWRESCATTARDRRTQPAGSVPPSNGRNDAGIEIGALREISERSGVRCAKKT
jgi:hypothetical protein